MKLSCSGGFVPREPSYFETQYHSTDLNLEIGMGVTVVPAEMNPHRKNDGNHVLDNFYLIVRLANYQHREQ